MHLYLTVRPTLFSPHPRLSLLFLLLLPDFSPLTVAAAATPRRQPLPRVPVRTHRQGFGVQRHIIHLRGQSHQTERARHIVLVQIVNVVHIPKAMGGIRDEVAPICIPRQRQQPLILIDMILNVTLHISQLVLGNFEFAHGNAGRVVILEEALLSWIQKEEAASHPVRIARDSRHPQNVLGRIVGRLELDHPIDRGGNIEIPPRRVGRAEYPRIPITEFEKSRNEFLPRLLPVHG
mmetsp:Transcript_11515/g.20709  ORF Transcript_11515/g.20709 Transcript_11515/m.20709 type:complete len:235 (-) Transcript_11515:1459-2163(-)